MKKELEKIKELILQSLLENQKELDLEFSSSAHSESWQKVDASVRSILKANRITLNFDDQKEIFSEVIADLMGLGPIDALLKDPTVTEIMINGPKQVYVERAGMLELTSIVFQDEAHLSHLVERIVAPAGRRVTEMEPYIDASLKDGTRVNIVRSPVSTIGPVLTLRKFSHNFLNLDDLIRLGTLEQSSADFLKACVLGRRNIVFSGSAGSGKTTLLNALASLIPENERVVTIEETRELVLRAGHYIPLITRPATIEGKGEITIRDVFRNVLHMRPDRVIIGEVRSGEALDMIQAMNTGHDGSMVTLHANSPFDALDRLEMLVLMGGSNISSEVAKKQIIRAIDLVIHLTRLPSGKRSLIRVSEVKKGKEYEIQDIIVFEPDQNGVERLKFTGIVPTCYPLLKQRTQYCNPEFERV